MKKQVLCLFRRYLVFVFIAILFFGRSKDASAEGVLELPANVKVIEEEAFLGSNSIEHVVLPETVQIIEQRAFADSSLTEIDISNPFIEIADNAFENHGRDLVIKGRHGSDVETYALDHGIRFASLETSVILTQSWEDFAGVASALVQNYEGNVSISSEGSAYSNGRIIIKMDGDLPDLSQFDPEAIIRDPENHYMIQFLDSDYAESCADYLAAVPGVVYVEPDNNLSGNDMYIDDFESQSYSWGVSATNSDAYAADLRKRKVGTSVIVAVVDTGVDFSHPMLGGRLVQGYDFVDNDDVPQDGNRHGTHVSGTVIDCTPGLNIYIMPVRVLGNSGSGSSIGVAQGIRFAARNNANVINLSLGGGHSSYIDEAVEYALQQGVTVVVAAGNESDNTESHCPAHILGCITVSAVNQDKQRAYFSNYGSAVDIAAPGFNITSAIPGGGYASLNGTSMATPHVSAAAAMLLCDNPGLSPSGVESMLRSAATDLGASGWDAYFGAGFLNLESFVKSGPNQYTVGYNANGGTDAPMSQTKVEGVALTLSSTVPTRADSEAGSYTVTFAPNGGSVSPTSMNAARTTSYTFANWNTYADGSGESYSAGGTYSANASTTLYAQWNSSTQTAEIVLPTPTRNSYTFKGWSTDSNASAGVSGKYRPSGNVTLYAVWESNAVSGTWGNLNWTLDDGGRLTISGYGEMESFSSNITGAWNAYKESIKTVVIQSGVTSIGTRAFYNCINLTSVLIPSSVTSIKRYAFDSCTSLEKILIPFGLTSIDTATFDNCISLSSVIIPSSVTSIQERAFRNCSNLKTVAIPAGVTSISDEAFFGCTSLSYIYYDGVPGQWLTVSKGEYNGSLTDSTVLLSNYYLWGQWSPWQTEKVTGSSTRQVESKTQYRTLAKFDNAHGTVTAAIYVEWQDTPTGYNNGDYLGPVHQTYTDNYPVCYAENQTRTVYRYRDVVTGYSDYQPQWGSWSEWSTEPMEGTSSTQVDTKTQFRTLATFRNAYGGTVVAATYVDWQDDPTQYVDWDDLGPVHQTYTDNYPICTAENQTRTLYRYRYRIN